MRNVHKLTEGAVLLAVFAVLLLITIYIPFLGIVSNLFLAIPFILYGAKNTRMNAVVFLIASIIMAFIVGNVLGIPLTIFYGLTGLVIGQLIRTGKSRTISFMVATLVFLITLVILYAGVVVFFEINIIDKAISIMKESYERSSNMLEALGQKPAGDMVERFEAGIKMIESLVPSLFVLLSLCTVILIEVVSFPIVKRFGVKVESWQPFREIVFPKSILWYYLVTILASLILKPEEGSYWFLAIINISFILQLIMALQGLSFIYYICYRKGVTKGIPIIATVFTFVLPIFLPIMRILGIIDLGFDLRKRLEKSE